MSAVHYRTCHLCEAMCGLKITLDGRTIARVEGDEDDPFSRGHLCPKAAALADLHSDPDRLRRPVRRVGPPDKGRWREIGWDEAFDFVADRLTAIQTEHGPAAVASYTGNPTVHNYGAILHGQLLRNALSTPNNFSATSLDQLPHMLASFLMFGHQLRLPVPDVDRTALWVIVGANPAVSNGSLMSTGDAKGALKAVQRRGGRVVVIDPRRTETAALADEHLYVHPGTDAALLAAIARHIFEAHGPRLGRLAPHVDGLLELRAALGPFAPDRVERLTGIAADDVRRLADDLVGTERAVLYGRLGVCVQPFGGLAAWLVNVVNALAGNLDAVGGSMFPDPAIDLAELAGYLGLRGSFGQRRSRVRGYPEFGGELPTVTLADEILTPGRGQVRALVTSAGNPVLSSPGGPRLAEALGQLEHMVSIDIYINETTRFADVILPPTFGIEKDHYDLALYALAVRNAAKYSPAAWPRDPDQRHDWEIHGELARRIERRRLRRGQLRGLRRTATMGVLGNLGRLSPDRALDVLLRLGPRRLSLSAVKRSPHGLDLGPLTPRMPDALPSHDRVIHLAPSAFLGDLPRLQARLTEPPAELVLIGRRNLRSNNSWMHNSRRLTKGKPRCTLLMHVDDARARGLDAGQLVRVATDAGAIEVPLETSDGIKRGVVSLPHGWGHGQPGTMLRVAGESPGANANAVIRPDVDPLSGTACLTDVPVTVVAAAAPAGPLSE